MTTYTTIANSEIDAGSIITESLMTRLRDNPIAITEGSTGAPKNQTASLEQGAGIEAVTQATIRDSAVGQAQLKTTTEVETARNTQWLVSTVSGGQYCFMPQTQSQSGGIADSWILGLFDNWNADADTSQTYDPDNLLSYATRITLGLGKTDNDWRARFRYVQASFEPDLGDGPIPFFAFLHVDKNGSPKHISLGRTAPWDYNGPTVTTGRYVGTRYCRKMRPSVAELYEKGIRPESLKGKELIDFAKRYQKEEPEYVEITQKIKNMDMDLIPHPTCTTFKDHTTILLDPQSEILLDLADMQDDGFDVCGLLTEGDLIYGNEAINRKSPPGVMPVSLKWR